jgi:ubiquinone biosynthesis protein
MVVVEGVARSLDPQMNIWKTAQPIVEDYIKKSIGPRAVLRDLSNTAQVLARFGPRLPALVEAALIRQSTPIPPPYPSRRSGKIIWGGIGFVVGIALSLLILDGF